MNTLSKIQLLLCIGLIVTAPHSCFAEEIDRVVATIEGEPVVLSEVAQFAATSLGRTDAATTSDPGFGMALQEFISGELIRREANALGIVVLDEEVKAYIEEIKRQNGVEDVQFNELLLSRGLTREAYERQVHQDILRTRIVSKEVRSSVTVSTEDVDRFFEKHPDRKPPNGSVRVRQIFVPLEEKAVLQEIQEKLALKQTMAQAGRKYYSDIGYVELDDLREELSAALEKLSLGGRSGVIKSDKGFYVLEVVARVSKDGKIDGAVADEIRNELYEKEFQERLNVYLKEKLPKKYLVEFLL